MCHNAKQQQDSVKQQMWAERIDGLHGSCDSIYGLRSHLQTVASRLSSEHAERSRGLPLTKLGAALAIRTAQTVL
jgi:hypothetical protein